MAMYRTYTETYDMNTEVGYPTVLGIHTPIGPTPYRMLEPAFRMYKKYKYCGADITIVNSARLPADPEQVGKVSGTNYISPKDLLDPILFKGCHGESLGGILDSMYNGLLTNSLFFHGSGADRQAWAAAFENFYYTAIGDDSWRKSPIQKTLSIKGLRPLVYSLSTNHQILPSNGLSAGNYKENNPGTPSSPALTGNTPGAENGASGISINPATSGWGAFAIGPTAVADATGTVSGYQTGLNAMFTSKMHRLGWLDTFQYIGQNTKGATTPSYASDDLKLAMLPKIFMGILMFPPAHLCRQYVRVIIRHKFKFAQYRSITEGSTTSWDGTAPIGYIDHFTGNVTEKGDYRPSDPECVDGKDDPDREPIEGDDFDGNESDL